MNRCCCCDEPTVKINTLVLYVNGKSNKFILILSVAVVPYQPAVPLPPNNMPHGPRSIRWAHISPSGRDTAQSTAAPKAFFLFSLM
jgi:hypothetical protein